MDRVLLLYLVSNRRQFTEWSVTSLYRHTDWDLVKDLVFVNDQSIDGADQVCWDWVRRTGRGTVLKVIAGSVTNAIYAGSDGYLSEDYDYVVVVANDMILCPRWLETLVYLADHNRAFGVVALVDVNEFFFTSPGLLYQSLPMENYQLLEVPYTGGINLTRWEVFKRYRTLGVTPDPANYIVGSNDMVQRSLTQRGLLRIGAVKPHMPFFKLDKMAQSQYLDYGFFEHAGIDRTQVIGLIEDYARAGYSRKRWVDGHIENAF